MWNGLNELCKYGNETQCFQKWLIYRRTERIKKLYPPYYLVMRHDL